MLKRVTRFCKEYILTFTILCGLGSIASVYADGLPGEYLATQRWRFLFSSQTPVSNPALINEVNYLSARYAFSSSMKAFKMHEAGVVYPIDLYHTVGLSLLYQGVDPYEATNSDFEVTGETINDKQYFFMGSYAWNVIAGLTVGANLNFFLYPFNNSEIGLGADIGLTYRLLNNPIIGNHLLGLNIQNAYVQIVNSSEKYPRNLRLSLNSSYWERKIESSFDFAFKDIGTSAGEFSDGAKTEWDLNAKLGFWVLRLVNLYGILSMSNDGLESWGLAGGFNIPSVNNGRDASILCQYMTSPEADFDGSFTIYARADVGKHREEVYARKMAKLVSLKPNDLYVRAVELYSQGNYWDALFLFSQLQVEFPDFFKSDWVGFFLSSCQEYMDMRTTAEEAYKKTKALYPRSAVIPFADLGLMRVYYRDNDANSVRQQFNELNKLGVPDSIKYYGYYLMGQTEQKQGNPSKAIQLYEMIPEGHSDYVFAQHAAAVVAASQNNIQAAVTHLENCIQTQVTTNAQKEIVNRSYVFLGYIFYEELTKEEGTLAKAVTALRMVPKTSYFYQDALLGIGWTALKARQWADCITSGQEIASVATNTVVKAEGTLLQAYANMVQKNNSAAAALLENISVELEKYQSNLESEFNGKKQEYNDVRMRYNDLARSVYGLATARQSALVEKQIDSMHVLQKQFFGDINNFISYSDNYQRTTFFNRNLEDVKGDIDYALAKAKKASGTSKTLEKTGKINKEAEKINDELEKLKKELENAK